MFGAGGKGGGSSSMASQKPQLMSLRIQTSIYGQGITIIFGTNRVAGKLIWQGDFHSVNTPTNPHTGGGKGLGQGSSAGGKGGTSTSTTTFHVAVAIALCQGQVDGLLNIWSTNGKLQLLSETQIGTVPGGGGAIVVTPPQSGAFHSVLGVSRMDAYSLAGVNDYGSDGPTTVAGTQLTPMTQVGSSPGAGQFTQSGTTFTFSSADAGQQVVISYVFSVPPDSSTSGVPATRLNVSLFTGAVDQTAWGYLTSNHANEAIGYSEVAYAAIEDLDLGTSGALPNFNWEVMGLKRFLCGQIDVGGSNSNGIGQPWGQYGVPGLDAEPFTIIKEVLTNALFSIGWDTSLVTNINFQEYCIANGILASPVIDSQVTIADFITKLCEFCNGEPVWSEGTLKMISYGDTTVVGNGKTFTPATSPIYDLTMDDIQHKGSDDPVKQSRPSVADAFNAVSVEFLNRVNDYNPEIAEGRDQGAIETYGLRKEDPRAYHGITSPAVARLVAHNIVTRNVNIRNKYTFELGLRFILLDPMDLVTLPVDATRPSVTPVRITSIKETDNQSFEFEAEEFPWGTAQATLYPNLDGLPFSPNMNADPGSVNDPIIFEATHPLSESGSYEVWLAVCGGKQNSNLLLWSEQFDNPAWTCTGTITANQVNAPSPPAPASTQTADKFTVVGLLGSSILSQLTNTVPKNGETYNFSIWARTASGSATIGLGVGQAGGSSAGSTPTISSSWQRFDLPLTISGVTGYPLSVQIELFGTAGVLAYLWGAQLTKTATVQTYAATSDAPIQGQNPNWGGCTVWLSTDGSSYKVIDRLKGGARMGVATNALGGTSTTGPALDGATGFISTTSNITAPATVSVEAWFKTVTTQGGVIAQFAHDQTAAPAQYDRQIYMDNNGLIQFEVYDNGAATQRTIASVLPYNDGSLHHVVGTYTNTSSGMNLYVDGTLLATYVPSFTSVSYSGFWRIGSNVEGLAPIPTSAFFNGIISHVAVYSSILTPTKISAHYSALANGSTSALEAAVTADSPTYFWKLTETGGTTFTDSIASNTGNKQGTLTLNQTATVGAHLDPDDGSVLSVDLTESNGQGTAQLLSGSQADEDSLRTLCYLDGELISYRTATLTAEAQYNLTHLRRGQLGTASKVHAAGAVFARLDAGIFKYQYDPAYIGRTLYIKFTSFNLYETMEQSLAAVTEYTFVPSGGVTAIIPVGKQLLSNPGFEVNTMNAPAFTEVPVGQLVVDSWRLLQKDNVWSVTLESWAPGGTEYFASSGRNNLLMRLKSGVTIPNDSLYRTAIVLSEYVACKPGDIFAFNGTFRFDRNATAPAGLNIFQRVAIRVMDANFNDISATTPGTNYQIGPGPNITGTGVYVRGDSILFEIPALINGAVPQYACLELTAFAQNTGGSNVSTGSNFYSDLRFDDMDFMIGIDGSNYEVTPLGSIPPTLTTAFSYASTTSSITWTWTGLQIARADGSVASVPDGSLACTGLSTNTLYYFWPYYEECLLDTDPHGVNFVTGGTNSAGSPAIAFTAKTLAAAQYQQLFCHVPLSVGAMSASTTSSGSGGGSGGGSGVCLRSNMLVDCIERGVVPISTMQVGEHLNGPEGVTEVVVINLIPVDVFIRITTEEGDVVEVTPTHPLDVIESSGKTVARIAEELRVSDALFTKKGVAQVHSIVVIHTTCGEKASVTCSPSHRFYAGEKAPNIVTHNSGLNC